MKKIALFGGTFDPVHNGHVDVAEYACGVIGAQKVIMIPAKRSPHKNSSPFASAQDRTNMVSLAIASRENFDLSDCETTRAEPSYTLDTIEYFQSKYAPDTQLYWLIGADSLKDLTKWHRIRDILELCTITVMFRAGFAEPDFSEFARIFGWSYAMKLSESVIQTPLIEISSTDIRRKIASGQSVENLIHPDVFRYIIEKRLYR